MGVIFLACLLLAGIVTCDEKKSYRGHHVVSAQATTDDQLSVLRHLEGRDDLVFLREPSKVLSTDLTVPPDQKDQIVDTLTKAGINVTVQSTDLQAEIDAEMRETLWRKLHRGGPFLRKGRFSPPHDTFYNLTEVNDIMANFAASYPDLAVRKQMKLTSGEYQWPYYYLEIGTATDLFDVSYKPVIFVEGLAHAREWAGTASLIYVVDQMLSGFVAGDMRMLKALTTFTWVIIPVTNPDGYHYTWTKDRLWRKNRRLIRTKRCRGVDLNRNYDVDFGNTGVSSGCTDIYPGEYPFSEPETQNIRHLFRQLQDRVVAYLSVHAYSQLLLYPWGYIESEHPSKVPANIEQLISVGKKMKKALDSQGKTYILGTAYGVLGYAASGASEDWALQEKPDIYAYCYELRPQHYYQGHFILPPSQIAPTGEELLRSLLVLADSIWEEER